MFGAFLLWTTRDPGNWPVSNYMKYILYRIVYIQVSKHFGLRHEWLNYGVDSFLYVVACDVSWERREAYSWHSAFADSPNLIDLANAELGE